MNKDDAAVLTQARTLGLNQLVEHYSDDILVAARVAEKLKASFVACDDLTSDIWPAMTVKE